MARVTQIPSTRTIVWTIILSLIAVGLYNSDALGLRSKIVNKLFPPSA